VTQPYRIGKSTSLLREEARKGGFAVQDVPSVLLADES
jgi:hypothetical protein